VSRRGGLAIAALLLLVTVPFLLETIAWWLGNDPSLVSFSLIMPLAAAAACWIRYRTSPVESPDAGLQPPPAVLLLPVLLSGLYWALSEPILGAAGLWTALVAVLGLLRGRAVGRHYALPLLPLLFLAPLARDLPANLETPLQTASAAVAEIFLRVGGEEVVRTGVILDTPSFRNIVDRTCSGVSTLTTLIVFSVILALIVRLRDRRIVVAALLSIPLGIVINGARIAWISLLGEYQGVAVAMGDMHDTTGYVTFAGGYAVLLLVVLTSRRGQEKAGSTPTKPPPPSAQTA
jgi:exosortase